MLLLSCSRALSLRENDSEGRHNADNRPPSESSQLTPALPWSTLTLSTLSIYPGSSRVNALARTANVSLSGT